MAFLIENLNVSFNNDNGTTLQLELDYDINELLAISEKLINSFGVEWNYNYYTPNLEKIHVPTSDTSGVVALALGSKSWHENSNIYYVNEHLPLIKFPFFIVIPIGSYLEEEETLVDNISSIQFYKDPNSFPLSEYNITIHDKEYINNPVLIYSSSDLFNPNETTTITLSARLKQDRPYTIKFGGRNYIVKLEKKFPDGSIDTESLTDNDYFYYLGDPELTEYPFYIQQNVVSDTDDFLTTFTGASRDYFKIYEGIYSPKEDFLLYNVNGIANENGIQIPCSSDFIDLEEIYTIIINERRYIINNLTYEAGLNAYLQQNDNNTTNIVYFNNDINKILLIQDFNYCLAGDPVCISLYKGIYPRDNHWIAKDIEVSFEYNEELNGYVCSFITSDNGETWFNENQEISTDTPLLTEHFILNEVYTIIWDDKRYTCTAIDGGAEMIACGNLWYNQGQGYATGEPFVLGTTHSIQGTSDSFICLIGTPDPSPTHTISIYKGAQKPIFENAYLDNNFMADMAPGGNCVVLMGDQSMKLGHEYTIVVDGETYTLEAFSGSFAGFDVIGVGNPAAIGVGEDNGIPFACGALSQNDMTMFMLMMVDPDARAEQHIVSLYEGPTPIGTMKVNAVVNDKNGNPKVYENIKTLSVNTNDNKIATFILESIKEG